MSKKEKEKLILLPSTEELKQELDRVRKQRDYISTWKRTGFGLATVAAIAILVAIIFLPVLQIYGESMTPTFHEGDIVVSVKGESFAQGDILCFYYNNTILVKRVIAFPGQWVDIEEDGSVTVNGKLLEEPYVSEPAFGNCDIELPYQVPDGYLFVMGDHRATSKDSRSSSMGCIPYEKVVGKIAFRIWPFSGFGKVE